MDIQKLRKEYSTTGIDIPQMDRNPLRQFQHWFEVAIKSVPGDWCEPNAVTIASCGAAQQPTARTVLMKAFSEDGFEFFTNYESEKAQQIAENPFVCMLFHWPWLDRQIRIDGPLVKTSRERSLEYFHSRPRGAQIGAHASLQSQTLRSREELDERRKNFESEFANNPIPLPDYWGGYLLRPERIEFWQGRLDRLHDRLVYELDDDGWAIRRVSP